MFHILSIKERIQKLSFNTIITTLSTATITTTLYLLYSNFSGGSTTNKINNQEHLQYWGQIGDFIGGTLNPTLSFLALMAVLHTIKIQRLELKDAREEAKLANIIQTKQTEIFERQNFEAALFRLFDVHNKITDRLLEKHSGANSFISITKKIKETLRDLDSQPLPKTEIGAYAARYIKRQHEIGKIARAASTILEKQNPGKLSHYFRNIYQILKAIDEYSPPPDTSVNERINRRKTYLTRRRYSSMFRAVLTDEELKLITANCFTKQGFGMKQYVERYSLLKHLERDDFLEGRDIALEFFNATAFLDSDKISDSHITQFDRAPEDNKNINIY